MRIYRERQMVYQKSNNMMIRGDLLNISSLFIFQEV